MSKKGWVKLYRSLQDHWLWEEEKPFDKRSAWIDILLMVNHEKKKVKLGNELIIVNRGERITSERKLADKWGWSRTKVRNFLELLEKDNMLKVKKDTKKTTLKVLNYGDYQRKENHKKTSKKPDENHQETNQVPDKNTNKNDKNVKNDKNTSSSTSAGTRESDNNKGVSADIKIRNWLHTYWGRKEVTEKRVQALVKFTDKVDLDLIKDAIIRSQNARDPFTYCCGSYDDNYVLKGGMLNRCINQGVTCIEDLQNNSGGDDGGECSRGDQEEVRDNDRKKQAKHRARRI